jgi:indolepyruvate ferredoxin oxidoreductase beta subunit
MATSKSAARKSSTAKGEVPVKILIAAMGGEGGGVLTSWIVEAARSQDLPVQATSIPGVAQRTGATTYYIEIVPTPYSKLQDKTPVLDLYPAPGDIDLMVATELLETGRVIEKGFVNPDRTTLIASTHRVYSLAEKMDMADGRYEGEKVLEAAKHIAKRSILFDMDRAAQDAGSIINSVILGAIAGAGILPITPEVFEQGIKDAGKAVKSNLAGFAAGRAYAEGKVVEARPKTKRAAAKPKPAKLEGAAKTLRERVERDYKKALQPIVMEAAGRCLDFQDEKYATLYLDRLDGVRETKGADDGIVQETARHLGLRMAYEDVIRVAQFKTRASRFERVRGEVGATPDQLVRVTEFLKPGPEEFAQVLPRFIGGPVSRWADRNPDKARKLHFGMHVRSDTVSGFLRMRMMAGARRFRRMGYRYGEEQTAIEHWLDLIRRAAAKDKKLAREVIECARLIKGYGDTHKRGSTNFARITEQLIEPAIEGGLMTAADIAKARAAALADPEGNALDAAFAEIAGVPSGEGAQAAE